MDTAILSATSALVGSAIGAFSSFATTWLSQTTQSRSQRQAREATKREGLYAAFLTEAAKRLAEAIGHQPEGPEVLVGLHALVGRMRLVSSPEVVDAATAVVRLVLETYVSPNKTLAELRQAVANKIEDPLAAFGEACRTELSAIR